MIYFSSINIRNLNNSQDKYEALMDKQRNISQGCHRNQIFNSHLHYGS